MNKPLSSILITALAILFAMPVLSVPAYAAPATVAVNPQASSAPLGATFTVQVDVSNAANLIGYDLTLNYAGSILNVVSADFSTTTLIAPLCASSSCFPVVTGFSDTLGTVRTAFAILGGSTVQVTTPQALLKVTFKVVGAGDSPLALTNVGLVGLLNGGAVSIPATTTDGQFLLPPSLVFRPPNAQALAGDGNGCTGNVDCSDIILTGYIMLATDATRAGFGGVRFTLVGPQGTHTYDSNIVFLFPGQSATVTHYIPLTNVAGTYQLFATILLCPVPTSCTPGQTVTGVSFRV
jgi:hypothetical protein